MEDIRWIPVWTDEDMLKIVIGNNLSIIEKFREDFNKGEVKIKIPFLEYKTGTLTETKTLPFTKENDLAKVLEVSHIRDILGKVKNVEDFNPFVVNLESNFHMMVHSPRWVRAEADYLLSISKIREKFDKELENIKNHSDAELESELTKGMYNAPPNNRSKISMRKYRDFLRTDFPNIDNMIADEVVSKKPTVISRFKGKQYLTYFAGEEEKEFGSFFVYLPLESSDDLPNNNSFKARIIGIMFFNSNPPRKGLSPLTFVGVSLFLPWKR